MWRTLNSISFQETDYSEYESHAYSHHFECLLIHGINFPSSPFGGEGMRRLALQLLVVLFLSFLYWKWFLKSEWLYLCRYCDSTVRWCTPFIIHHAAPFWVYTITIMIIIAELESDGGMMKESGRTPRKNLRKFGFVHHKYDSTITRIRTGSAVIVRQCSANWSKKGDMNISLLIVNMVTIYRINWLIDCGQYRFW